MSDYILPAFQGISTEKDIYPDWNNEVFKSVSRVETVLENDSYPLYYINLNYDFMTDAKTTDPVTTKDVETLMTFVNYHRGNSEEFLYLDDVDYALADQQIGIGDGVTRSFQLIRTMQGWGTLTWNEPILGILAKPTIKVGGVATTDFTWTTRGVITFTNAPTDDAVILMSGTYYYRCKFVDIPKPHRVWHGLYRDIALNLITVKK